MSKSICSFIRKELKVKGKTEHNGRGVYVMDNDCTFDELKVKVQNQLIDWDKKGIVESSKIDDENIHIVFTKQFNDGYYRSLIAHKMCAGMSVQFTL